MKVIEQLGWIDILTDTDNPTGPTVYRKLRATQEKLNEVIAEMNNRAEKDLRDWFAGQALQNLFRYDKNRQLISVPEDVALRAYMFADAMLVQRAEKLEV